MAEQEEERRRGGHTKHRHTHACIYVHKWHVTHTYLHELAYFRVAGPACGHIHAHVMTHTCTCTFKRIFSRFGYGVLWHFVASCTHICTHICTHAHLHAHLTCATCVLHELAYFCWFCVMWDTCTHTYLHACAKCVFSRCVDLATLGRYGIYWQLANTCMHTLWTHVSHRSGICVLLIWYGVYRRLGAKNVFVAWRFVHVNAFAHMFFTRIGLLLHKCATIVTTCLRKCHKLA